MPYQEKKILEKKVKSPRNFIEEKDIFQDERLAWLALHIEAPLKEYSEIKESFTDGDAILALEYAKEKINREERLIFIPGKENTPQNKAGDAVYHNIEKCRYEKKIIIPGEQHFYSKEEKIKCLERIILSVKFLARGNFRARNYIQHLISRFEKIKELSIQNKLITTT